MYITKKNGILLDLKMLLENKAISDPICNSTIIVIIIMIIIEPTVWYILLSHWTTEWKSKKTKWETNSLTFSKN